MSNSKKKVDWLVVAGAILCLVLAALGAYLGGYFAMSKGQHGTTGILGTPPIFFRVFAHKWQVTIYATAMKVESLCRGKDVVGLSTDVYGPP